MGAPTYADAPLLTGRIVRFEDVRGYGFVAPDDGDEDVFVHANDLASASQPITCGTRVEFRVVDGGRGPKAYDVRVLDDDAPAAVAVAERPPATQTRTTATPAAVARPPAPASAPSIEDSTEELCEVLSEREFTSEVTELLLAADERLTAAQMLAIREALCHLARSHGWVD